MRFCCTTNAGKEVSILTVDPTFCLGAFECTPTTYRHLPLVSQRHDAPPIFVGPKMIHCRKNFSSFLFFTSFLLAIRRNLESLKCFGTDGEKALVDAFLHNFRFAIHPYCYSHSRSNVKGELQNRKLSQNGVSQIIADIYGKHIGAAYCEGLVDAMSEEDLYKKSWRKMSSGKL